MTTAFGDEAQAKILGGGCGLSIIKLVYQIFKPGRPENHYVQNQYFQNRKRYYVKNNQYQ